ncbi:MAG: GspE/PulE family protein, partial [Planctomycetales bacterium]
MDSQIGFSADEHALVDLRQTLIKGLKGTAILLEEEMGWVTPEDPIAEMHEHVPPATIFQAFQSTRMLECFPMADNPGASPRLIAAMRASHANNGPRSVDSTFIPLFDHLRQAVEFADASLSQIHFLLLPPERYDELSGLAGDGDRAKKKRLDKLHQLDPKASASSAYARIIRSGLHLGASDIHIEPVREGYRIRLRIHGDLHQRYLLQGERGIKIGRELVNIIKIEADLKIQEHRLPQDGRITFVEEEFAGYSLRVSIIPTQAQRDGEKAVLRILQPANPEEFDLAQLGLDAEILNQLQEILQSTHGILLVTGPTGSGKTTTLYSVLRELNDGARNISTVEDPVEVRFNDMNQSQVHPGIGLSFSSLLRSFLRQDPDVILVGEIRDEETASIAIRAAQTGHLVLSTLHTNDACAVLPRLKGMNTSGEQLQGALRGVLAQRLVRRMCPSCAVEYDASEDLNSLLSLDDQEAFPEGVARFARPGSRNGKKYCRKCANTGYVGRLPVVEMWVPTAEEMHRMIYEPQFTDRDLLEMAVRGGMRPIWASAFGLVVRKET